MRKKNCYLLLSVSLLVFASGAWGSATYTYTGQPFNVLYGTQCPPVCRL
jgi:hypothetical protein